jgi:polyribonucleotide nucleotidyltransferase
MVTGIDPEGKVRLSRTAVLEGWTVEEAAEHDRKPSGGGRSGGSRSGPGAHRPSDRGGHDRGGEHREHSGPQKR